MSDSVFSVADEAAMLALPAVRGDIAVCNDRASYALRVEPPSVLGNWTRLTVNQAGDAMSIRHWCKADGVAADEAGFAQAVADRAGLPILVPAGCVLTFSSLVTLTDKLVHLIFEKGASIRHRNNAFLKIYQTPTRIGGITAIGTATVPAGFYKANTASTVTVDVANPGLVRGDIVIVTCDDHERVTGGDPTVANRAELAEVTSVSGAVVTLSALLHGPYDRTGSNPTLYKLNPNKVVIEGLKAVNPTYLSDTPGTGVALELWGCVRPVVQAEFDGAGEAAFAAVSCWCPEVDLRAFNSRDVTTASSFGYGCIVAAMTRHGRFKVYGQRNRHTVTFGGMEASDVLSRGAQRDNLVYDSLAVNPLSSGFDTHSDAFFNRFMGCGVVSTHGNVDNGSSELTIRAFNDRAAGTVWQGCWSRGLGGFQVYSGSTERRASIDGQPYRTRIVDHHNDSNQASEFYVQSSPNANAVAQHEIEVCGGYWKNTRYQAIAGAPPVIVKGGEWTQQGSANSWAVGAGNVCRMEDVTRLADAGGLSNIVVNAGSTLILDGYRHNGTSFSNNTLVSGKDGSTGTAATLNIGRVFSMLGYMPSSGVYADAGGTPLVVNQLGQAHEQQNIGLKTANFVPNWNGGRHLTFIAGANLTVSASAPRAIGLYTLTAIQDTTGNRTVNLGGGYVQTPGNVVSGSANQRTTWVFFFDGLVFQQISPASSWH